MSMYDMAYESYKQKCRELGLAPTSKAKIFAEDIVKKQNDDHVNIVTLSKAKKQKAPVLSEIAKEALIVPKKRKPKVKKIAAIKSAPLPRVKKIAAAPKPKKDVVVKIKVKKIVIPKPKIEKPVKQKRVLLSDEEKKARQKEASRLYHLARKNDPAYQARRNANTREWNKNNKEKIAATNKKYRDEVRTPQQLEEKLAKAREYRQKNLEHMRKKDRARKDQRREYLDNNPEARERRREYDRKRHAESMADTSKAEKLREKWRKDGAKKRKKIT